MRAGPAKKRTMFPKALASPLLRVRTGKLEALTLTQHCTFTTKSIWKKLFYFILLFFFSHSISPRYPPKLKSTNFSTLNSYKTRRSRSTWNLVETMLDSRTSTIRHPIKRYHQNSISICKSSVRQKMGKMAFLRCLAQFYGFRSEKFNLVFGPQVQKTESRPFCFFVF